MEIKEKYVLSSVIPNASVNKKFLKALELYCKENKAELMLWHTKMNKKDSLFDANLYNDYLMFDSMYLNEHLEVKYVNQRHLAVNPLSGLNYIKGCKIIPAPRLMLKSLPRQIKKDTLPRAIFTTGTICNAEGYGYTKSNDKALTAHKENGIGAIVVEVYENGFFNCRHLVWKKNCFYDFVEMKGVRKYTDTKSSKVVKDVGYMVFGDTHLSHADKTVLKARDKVVERLKPKKVFHHDILDGSAEFINHHIQNMVIKRIKSSKVSAIDEIDQFCQFLKEQLKKHRNTKIFIVASNHHEFYMRILEDRHRLKEVVDTLTKELMKPDNIDRFSNIMDVIVLLKELFEYKCKGKDPLREYCVKRYPELKKVKFLTREDSVIINGKELANHGDVGPNGARGSFNSIKNSNPGGSIQGHTHTPIWDEYGGIWVGTIERFDADYCNASGYSAWAHCDCIGYVNGGNQMIFYLNNDINKSKCGI